RADCPPRAHAALHRTPRPRRAGGRAGAQRLRPDRVRLQRPGPPGGLGGPCYTRGQRIFDMAILKVARLGHPVLRQPSLPVPLDDSRSPETQRLIDYLEETMREYNGAVLRAARRSLLTRTR